MTTTVLGSASDFAGAPADGRRPRSSPVAPETTSSSDASRAAGELVDEELLRRIRRGDEAAFALLVNRHATRFHRIAWRVLGRSEDVEEILQEAFLRLWTRPDLWQPGRGARFTTWFHRVVVNLALDRLRSERRRGELDRVQAAAAEVVASAASPEQAGAEARRDARIAAAVATLPERQQAAIRLMFQEGMTGSEAAQTMGLKLKALQALVTRARATLRELLLREIEEEIHGQG